MEFFLPYRMATKGSIKYGRRYLLHYMIRSGIWGMESGESNVRRDSNNGSKVIGLAESLVTGGCWSIPSHLPTVHCTHFIPFQRKRSNGEKKKTKIGTCHLTAWMLHAPQQWIIMIPKNKVHSSHGIGALFLSLWWDQKKRLLNLQ